MGSASLWHFFIRGVVVGDGRYEGWKVIQLVFFIRGVVVGDGRDEGWKVIQLVIKNCGGCRRETRGDELSESRACKGTKMALVAHPACCPNETVTIL
jgi:hypothetical protein